MMEDAEKRATDPTIRLGKGEENAPPPEPASQPTLTLGGASSSPPPPSPLPSQQIGPYAVKGVIAQGGMGVVYRVHDPKLGRDVALKMMIRGSWASEDLSRRFLREAHLLGELAHPGIVPVHDMGVEKGAPYYTMDLVEGTTLDRYVRDEGLGLEDRMRLFIQVAHAVNHAHMKGVIHRDLKPGNILVTPEGQPVVLDFGIAHLSRMEQGEGAPDLFMTVSGVVMGTPLYMAPEQARGKAGAIDTRADVYSLGVILYELVTGKLPFEAVESFALMKAVIEEEPRRPSAFGVKLARDLEAVILKSIAKEKDRRYASVLALADDLQKYLDGKPVTAVPDTQRYRLGKWVRRHRELATASLMAGGLFVSFGSWAVWKIYQKGVEAERSAQYAREQRKTAEAERDSVKAERDKALRRNEADKRLLKLMTHVVQSAEKGGNRETDLAEADLAELDGILELAPDLPDALFRRAVALRRLDRLEEALADLEMVLKLQPERVYAWSMTMIVCRDIGKPDKALATVYEMEKRGYVDRITKDAKIDLLMQLGRKDEALETCSRYLEEAQIPHEIQWLRKKKATLLQAMERWQEALDAHAESMGTSSSSATWFEMGGCLEKLGRFQEAADHFRKAAAAVAPTPSVVNYRLGLALEQAGKPEEAIGPLEEAIARQEGSSRSYGSMNAKQLEDCRAHLKRLKE